MAPNQEAKPEAKEVLSRASTALSCNKPKATFKTLFTPGNQLISHRITAGLTRPALKALRKAANIDPVFRRNLAPDLARPGQFCCQRQVRAMEFEDLRLRENAIGQHLDDAHSLALPNLDDLKALQNELKTLKNDPNFRAMLEEDSYGAIPDSVNNCTDDLHPCQGHLLNLKNAASHGEGVLICSACNELGNSQSDLWRVYGIASLCQPCSSKHRTSKIPGRRRVTNTVPEPQTPTGSNEEKIRTWLQGTETLDDASAATAAQIASGINDLAIAEDKDHGFPDDCSVTDLGSQTSTVLEPLLMLLSRPHVYDAREPCIPCQRMTAPTSSLHCDCLYRFGKDIVLCTGCRKENAARYQRQVRKTITDKRVTIHRCSSRRGETPRHTWSAPTSCFDCGMSWAKLQETYPDHAYLDTLSADSWADDQAPEGMVCKCLYCGKEAKEPDLNGLGVPRR